MKKFLKKVFFWDSPEKGAFWSLVLILSGSWLLGTIFILCGGGYRALYSRCFVTGKYHAEALVWLIAPAVIFFLFFLHFLFQFGRSWHNFSWSACGRGCKTWLGISILLWAGTLASGIYSGILIKENWKLDYALHYVKEGGALLPLLLTVFLLLLLAGILATGKFYSIIGKFAYKGIFTLPVKFLAALTLVAYIGMVSASLIIQQKCETEKGALAKHFGRSLTAEALKKTALSRRKADGAFWKKISGLLKQDKNRETAYCDNEFTPAELASWEKRFYSSKAFAELDRMISTPLPSFPRKIEKYNLFAAICPDLLPIRSMARLQVWHCRFAAEKGDRTEAVAALKRLDNLSAYLADQPFLLCALVKQAVDSMKNRAVEYLLGSKCLAREDLLGLKQSSRAVKKYLKTAEKEILWSEALGSFDYMEGSFYAEKNWSGIKIVPWKKFRFLLPQFWLIYESNRLNIVRLYSGAEKFHDIKDESKNHSIFASLANVLHPSFQAAGNKFLQRDLEQRTIEFFIDQELYRLKHGKLPDDLPLPVDPFSQKPMKYIQGKVTLKKEIYEKGSRKITFYGRQLTSATRGPSNVTVTIPEKVFPLQ